MATNPYDIHAFLTITGSDAITINGTEGWTYMSLQVTSGSTASAVITSNSGATIGGKTQNGASIPPGGGTTVGSGIHSIDGVTITAPSGCTVIIQVVKYQPIIG